MTHIELGPATVYSEREQFYRVVHSVLVDSVVITAQCATIHSRNWTAELFVYKKYTILNLCRERVVYASYMHPKPKTLKQLKKAKKGKK